MQGIAIGILVIGIVFITNDWEKINNYIVDLPEEHESISHNSNKPDTVLAYYKHDTLFIEFKSKTNNHEKLYNQ